MAPRQIANALTSERLNIANWHVKNEYWVVIVQAQDCHWSELVVHWSINGKREEKCCQQLHSTRPFKPMAFVVMVVITFGNQFFSVRFTWLRLLLLLFPLSLRSIEWWTNLLTTMNLQTCRPAEKGRGWVRHVSVLVDFRSQTCTSLGVRPIRAAHTRGLMSWAMFQHSQDEGADKDHIFEFNLLPDPVFNDSTPSRNRLKSQRPDMKIWSKVSDFCFKIVSRPEAPRQDRFQSLQRWQSHFRKCDTLTHTQLCFIIEALEGKRSLSNKKHTTKETVIPTSVGWWNVNGQWQIEKGLRLKWLTPWNLALVAVVERWRRKKKWRDTFSPVKALKMDTLLRTLKENSLDHWLTRHLSSKG